MTGHHPRDIRTRPRLWRLIVVRSPDDEIRDALIVEVAAATNEKRLVEGAFQGPVGGLDIYLQHNFVIRMGEISYSKTYLHGWTMTPLTASAGIVYRLR